MSTQQALLVLVHVFASDPIVNVETAGPVDYEKCQAMAEEMTAKAPEQAGKMVGDRMVLRFVPLCKKIDVEEWKGKGSD